MNLIQDVNFFLKLMSASRNVDVLEFRQVRFSFQGVYDYKSNN